VPEGEIRLWRTGRPISSTAFLPEEGSVCSDQPDGRTLLIAAPTGKERSGTWSRFRNRVSCSSSSLRAGAQRRSSRCGLRTGRKTALTGTANFFTAMWSVGDFRTHGSSGNRLFRSRINRWCGTAVRQSALYHPRGDGRGLRPDGRSLVTACEDGGVRVWHRPRGWANVSGCRTAPGGNCCRVGLKGPSVSSCYCTGTLDCPRLRAVAGGQDTQRVLALASSLDGLAATGGEDGKVRLWNAKTGLPDGEPLVHESPVTSLSSPRNRPCLPGARTAQSESGI
jgi:WD40 repeat protein